MIPPFLFSAFLTLPEPSCLAFNGLLLPRIYLHWVNILQGRSIVAINRDEGVSVLLVEQNSRMALSISHRAYAMATGNVVIEGNSKELLHDDRIKAAYLGGEV